MAGLRTPMNIMGISRPPVIIDSVVGGWSLYDLKFRRRGKALSKIELIETIIVEIPTIRGHVLPMATMRTQTAILVKVKFADGSQGIGEGATIGGLTYGPESIQSAIDTYIAPALIGRDGDDINGAIQLVDKLVKGNRIAKTAAEIAQSGGLRHIPLRVVGATEAGATQIPSPIDTRLSAVCKSIVQMRRDVSISRVAQEFSTRSTKLGRGCSG